MKTIIGRIAVMIMTVTVIVLIPYAVFANDNKAMEIGSYDDLAGFISGINNGSIDINQNAVLTDDIRIPADVGNDWVPLGADEEHAFQGDLNGNGHTISGINIDRSDVYPDKWEEGINVGSYTAFISFLGVNGRVHDLSVEASITDVNSVGGIVSQNAGTISNCTFKGSLNSNIYPNSGSGKCYMYPDGVFNEADAESGCIAAMNMGTIENCSTLDNTTIFHGGINCGGIVGLQIEGGSITGCENNASVGADDSKYPMIGKVSGIAGGICGQQELSYYYGKDSQIDMLEMTYTPKTEQTEEERSGYISSQIDSKYQTVVVKDMFDPAEKPVISDCRNFGSVNSHTLAGGICGRSYTGDILSCENHSGINNDILYSRRYIGGITGYVGTDVRLDDDHMSEVSGCVNFGDVNAGSLDSDAGLEHCGMYNGSYVGGIAGEVTDNDRIKTKEYGYVRFFRNVNKAGARVCGNFGVGGVIGYLANKTYLDDSDGTELRKSYVYELVNLGDVHGSDHVGGVVGACPGVVTDTVNYGLVRMYPEDAEDYYYIGGITGNQSVAGKCSSSYSVGAIDTAVPMTADLEDKIVIGGVTGNAASETSVKGTYYCSETATWAACAVGTWPEEYNFGNLKLSEMGGDAAKDNMTALFSERSASLHRETVWNTVSNVTEEGKIYYMTPQMDWYPISFEELRECYYVTGQEHKPDGTLGNVDKASQIIKSVSPGSKTVKRGKSFRLKTKLSKGNGKVTYKKTGGSKYITVSKSGKVTVKNSKKLRKGRKYTIKVKVSVAETDKYKAASQTKTITIRIK